MLLACWLRCEQLSAAPYLPTENRPGLEPGRL
jgi:hypothetical protein